MKIYYTIIQVWNTRITLAIGTSMNAYKHVIDEAIYVHEVSDYYEWNHGYALLFSSRVKLVCTLRKKLHQVVL